MAISEHDREMLVRRAKLAAARAYCPYSNFHVGAAVLADGCIYTGCNVENASYGLTVCAERVAIFRAIAAGERLIDAIAVCCPDAKKDDPIETKMPCGACRQVIAEFAAPGMDIIVGDTEVFGIEDLLPSAFHL